MRTKSKQLSYKLDPCQKFLPKAHRHEVWEEEPHLPINANALSPSKMLPSKINEPNSRKGHPSPYANYNTINEHDMQHNYYKSGQQQGRVPSHLSTIAGERQATSNIHPLQRLNDHLQQPSQLNPSLMRQAVPNRNVFNPNCFHKNTLDAEYVFRQ